MGSPCDWIFSNALCRCEVTTHEVVLAIAPCGHDYPRSIHSRNCRDVRNEVSHCVFVCENSHVVELVQQNLNGLRMQSLNQIGRRRDRLGWPLRKIHHISASSTLYRQRAARCVKHNLLSSGFEALHHHRGTSKRGVPAERDLHLGCEPTQIVVAAFRNQERGFREIILRGDCLQNCVRKKMIQHYYGRWIAGKEMTRKCIDLKYPGTHFARGLGSTGDSRGMALASRRMAPQYISVSPMKLNPTMVARSTTPIGT